MSRVVALASLLWLLGFWTLFVYALIRAEYALAFGCAFASLALPLATDGWLSKEDA